MDGSRCTNQIIARISNANHWKDGLEKARAFVAELTLQEKADMGMLHSFLLQRESTGANPTSHWPAWPLRRQHLPDPTSQLQWPVSARWSRVSPDCRFRQRLPRRCNNRFIVGQEDDVRAVSCHG